MYIMSTNYFYIFAAHTCMRVFALRKILGFPLYRGAATVAASRRHVFQNAPNTIHAKLPVHGLHDAEASFFCSPRIVTTRVGDAFLAVFFFFFCFCSQCCSKIFWLNDDGKDPRGCFTFFPCPLLSRARCSHLLFIFLESRVTVAVRT